MSQQEAQCHFSPTLRAWAECDATEKACKYDHISMSDYQKIVSIEKEEKMMLESSIGEAEIKYIDAKTNMSVGEIQETLRELRREGSRLPAPTATELESFIEQERFKVENDPTLSKKEKRDILKNLREAGKDIKESRDGITGGVFHAWKNGMLATLAKIRKPVLVGALAGGLAFGLAACGPAPTTTDDTPTKNDKDTVQVVEDSVVLGDVATAGKASNSAGEYTTVVINPDSPALKYDPTKTSPALYEYGYTDAQLEAIQKQSVTTLVSEIVDNPTLGQPRAETEEWLKTQTILNPEVTEAYVSSTGGWRGHDITFSNEKILPPLVHDGGARIEDVSISVTSIQPRTTRAYESSAVSTDAEVMMEVTTSYRVAPETFTEWRMNTNLAYAAELGLDEAQTADIKTQTEAEVATLDTSKPLFIDISKTYQLGYTESDIKEGTKSPLIRSITSELKGGVGALAARN